MKKIEPSFPVESDESNSKKVLFADFAVVKYSSVIQWLKKDNVLGEGVTDPPKFLDMISKDFYDVCVVNLLLGGTGPFELIKNIRSSSVNPEIKIIVVSRQVQKMNIQNTIKAGANDFVAEPFENENLYHRILYHLSPKQVIDPNSLEEQAVTGKESWTYLNLLLESIEILSRTDKTKEHENILKILQGVADLVQSNRTSLIIVEWETNTGIVLASSDDPSFSDFPIVLSKYPEILHVMHSGSFVLIEDTSRNSLTYRIRDSVKSIQIGSLMVFPVRFQNEVMGVLTIRRPRARELPNMETLRVLQSLANTLAAHSNVKAILRKIYKDYALKTG